MKYNSLIEALVLGLDLAFYEYYFGFWVRGDEVFRESDGRHVADGAIVSEDTVSEGAGDELRGFGEVFGI